MIPDIESKHKGYRDQARMFLDNQTTLFKFILLKKGSMKTVAGAANHLTACQPYWLWGPHNCSYGAEILHRHVFHVS